MKNIVNKFILAGASGALAVASAYLIIPFEGEVVNKQGNHIVYKDIIGINTACWGQTGLDLDGNKPIAGATYTQEYCEKWYIEELTKYNTNMKRNVAVPLKEYEEIAYTSFVWNIGETKWNSSTLLKKLNAGDNLGACKELLRWNMAGGKPVKGLTNRRIAEYNVCTNQDSKVSDALEALHTAQEAPLNVDEEEHQPITVEAVVAPVETVVQATPPVCKVVFFGVCFWKGK